MDKNSFFCRNAVLTNEKHVFDVGSDVSSLSGSTKREKKQEIYAISQPSPLESLKALYDVPSSLVRSRDFG